MSEVERQATADAIGLHERASATPTREAADHAAKHGAAPAWALGPLDLRKQQEWFAAIVSSPEADPAPVDERSAARLVKPSKTLTSLERLEIYRRGYHARLIECLADDYPVLQHALGEAAFEGLCRKYIARHPSTGPSLNYFGRHMAALCKTEALPAFCADLATLEWAIVLGIHAPTAPALGFEDLGKVPPERWPGARFGANPSLSILRLDYGVNAYLQSFRDGAASLAPPAAQKNVVAVYRTGKAVWRLELDPALVTLVEALAAGATLEAGLGQVQTLLADRSEAEAAALVSLCFRHAVSSGLFSTLIV